MAAASAATAAAAKRLVLITGASGGIGFELAAQLLAKGTYHVLLGARSTDKGHAALQQLRSRNLPADSVDMLLLDVTRDDTIEAAAAQVRQQFGKLDILVNNAAVAPMAGGTLREYMRTAFDTNATGPLIVGNAFAPLLRESKDSPRIVNITSGAGSISSRLNRDSPTYRLQGHQYRASKSALNMITACQYVEYEPDGITVLLYDPGHTVSNLGPYNKAEFGARPPADSVMPLIDVIEGKRDEEAPKLLHNTGMYGW